MPPDQLVSEREPNVPTGGEAPLSALTDQVVSTGANPGITPSTGVSPFDPVLWEQFQLMQRSFQAREGPEKKDPNKVALVARVDWEKSDDIEPLVFLVMMWRIRESVLACDWSRSSQITYIKRHFKGDLASKVEEIVISFIEKNPTWDFKAFYDEFLEEFPPLSFAMKAQEKFKSLRQKGLGMKSYNIRYNCLLRFSARHWKHIKEFDSGFTEAYSSTLHPTIKAHILQNEEMYEGSSLFDMQKRLALEFPYGLDFLENLKTDESINVPLNAGINTVQPGSKKKNKSNKRPKNFKKRSTQAAKSTQARS